MVARLNARMFIEALRDEDLVYSEPAENLQEVRTGIQLKSVVVVGGFQPGQSTTAVSALCAEYCRARMVIYGTDVDGVYTADPHKDPTAKKLSNINYDELRALIVNTDNSLPGKYRIMDGMALTVLERSSIRAEILLGRKETIMNCVNGKHEGTIISSNK